MLLALPALLLAGTASAQPQPRERKERRVVLSDSPIELHVARGVPTIVVVDAPFDRDSVELEGLTDRFRLAEVGDRSLLLEPIEDLAPGERLELRARLLRGSTQEQILFVLVSHPSEVDARVEVFHPQQVEALQAELAAKDAELAARDAELAALRAQCEAIEPTHFVLSLGVDMGGLRINQVRFQSHRAEVRGLEATRVTGFRARSWTVLAVTVLNLSDQGLGAPTSARLLRADGRPVEVRRVRTNGTRFQPGEKGFVALEAEPVPSAGPFQLELLDAQGRRLLLLDDVTLWEDDP